MPYVYLVMSTKTLPGQGLGALFTPPSGQSVPVRAYTDEVLALRDAGRLPDLYVKPIELLAEVPVEAP